LKAAAAKQTSQWTFEMPFAIQPGIRVGGGRMRVVRPRLTMKVAAVTVRSTIFPLKTLLARPGPDQRPVDRRVLVRHVWRGPLDDASKELARQVGTQIGSSIASPANQRNKML